MGLGGPAPSLALGADLGDLGFQAVTLGMGTVLASGPGVTPFLGSPHHQKTDGCPAWGQSVQRRACGLLQGCVTGCDPCAQRL